MKKKICFPFVDGDLQDYAWEIPDEEETEIIYSGKPFEKHGIVWKPNEEVELTLHYDHYGRGRSAVGFIFKDDNGHQYPMFLTDMDDILKMGCCVTSIHAIFTYTKRGANYGIKFVRWCEND